MVIDDLLAEIQSAADEKNDQLLIDCLRLTPIAGFKPCPRCQLLPEYIGLKLRAHRIKKRLRWADYEDHHPAAVVDHDGWTLRLDSLKREILKLKDRRRELACVCPEEQVRQRERAYSVLWNRIRPAWVAIDQRWIESIKPKGVVHV